MRIRDLIGSAFGGLWRQKARTALTLLGVSVGTTALAFSLALGVGLRAFIENEFKSRREFWTINVHPRNWGTAQFQESDIPPENLAMPEGVPEERRLRLREKIVQDYQQHHRNKRIELITAEKIAFLKSLPDVEEVRSFRIQSGQFALGEKLSGGMVYAGQLDDFDPPLQGQLLYGRLPDPGADDECVVSEYALFLLGSKSDAQMESALGQTFQINIGFGGSEGGMLKALLAPGRSISENSQRSQMELLDKIAKQLPKQIDRFDLSDSERAIVKTIMAQPVRKPDEQAPAWNAKGQFRIVGVSKLPPKSKPDPADLFSRPRMPGQDVLLGPAAEKKLFSQIPEFQSLGYTDVTAMVRPGGNLEETVDRIEAAGMDTYNSLRFYRNVKREVTLISAGLNLFALLSLLVASIGIANTLFTSVLERTREIGIWKSLGARDGHILWLFLLEGAALGLLGSLLGWGFAFLLSLPADEWVKKLIESQRSEALISKTVFDWPSWLPTAVVTFSVILTTLAAIYPAFRAARVRPVEALRHE